MLLKEPKQTPDCLSDLQFDRCFVGEIRAAEKERIDSHVIHCPTCTKRLASLTKQWKEAVNLLDVEAATRKTITRHFVPQKINPWGYSLKIAWTFAILLTSTWLYHHLTTSERIKGSLSLHVVLQKTTGEQLEIFSGDTASPGDQLRFAVRTSTPGYATIISLEANGMLNIYVPSLFIIAEKLHWFEGSILLDTTLGVEKIVAFVCKEPLADSTLTKSVQDFLRKTNGQIDTIDFLPSQCSQTTLTLKKVKQ